MESAIASASRALISGVPGGFSIADLGAESSSASFPKTVLLKRQNSYKLLDIKGNPTITSFQGTYVGALFRASPLMPNLWAGFTTMTCLPISPVLFTSELIAERVVPVPFDDSTVVEGTDCPTTVSSPNADVRGILAAGLEKEKHKSKLANQ
jgi:hypothetical protein